MKFTNLVTAYRAASPRGRKLALFVIGAIVMIMLALAFPARSETIAWDNDKQGWLLFDRDAMNLMPIEWQADMARLWAAYETAASWDVPTMPKITVDNIQPEVCFRNKASGRLMTIPELTVYVTR